MSRSDRSPRDIARAAEAALLLTVLRIAVGRVPFRWLAKAAGLAAGGDAAPANQAGAERVRLALQRAAARLPFETTCLMQALAGAAMLRRRGVAATVQLGVARDGTQAGRLVAHAWLRAGDVVLTGADGADRFTPVAAYHLR